MARVIGKSKYFSNDELFNIDAEGKSSFDYLYITPDRLDKIIDSAQPSAIEVSFLKNSNKMLKEAMAGKERRVLAISKSLEEIKSILNNYRLEMDGYNDTEGFSLSQCLIDVLKRFDKIITDKARDTIELENILKEYERTAILSEEFVKTVSEIASKYPEFNKDFDKILYKYEKEMYSDSKQ